MDYGHGGVRKLKIFKTFQFITSECIKENK